MLLDHGCDVVSARYIQNLGVAEQGACNGDALSLATAEECALCAHKSVEAIWKGYLTSVSHQ